MSLQIHKFTGLGLWGRHTGLPLTDTGIGFQVFCENDIPEVQGGGGEGDERPTRCSRSKREGKRNTVRVDEALR